MHQSRLERSSILLSRNFLSITTESAFIPFDDIIRRIFLILSICARLLAFSKTGFSSRSRSLRLTIAAFGLFLDSKMTGSPLIAAMFTTSENFSLAFLMLSFIVVTVYHNYKYNAKG